MLNRDFSLWMRTKSKNKVSAGYTGRSRACTTGAQVQTKAIPPSIGLRWSGGIISLRCLKSFIQTQPGSKKVGPI